MSLLINLSVTFLYIVFLYARFLVINDVLSRINIVFDTFSHLQKSGDHKYH